MMEEKRGGRKETEERKGGTRGKRWERECIIDTERVQKKNRDMGRRERESERRIGDERVRERKRMGESKRERECVKARGNDIYNTYVLAIACTYTQIL